MTEFENEAVLSFDDPNLHPRDFIRLAFDRTDEDGILYIPGWRYHNPGWERGVEGSTDEFGSYRCRVDWNLKKRDTFLQRFEVHIAMIHFLAKIKEDLSLLSLEEAKEVLQDDTFFDFFSKYLHPLGYESTTSEIMDIEDRMDILETIRDISAEFAKGGTLSDYEKQTLIEYMDVSVSPEEEALYYGYVISLYKEAENRIGNRLCAYDVVIHSRRLYRLAVLNAPAAVRNQEACELAAAMLLFYHGKTREIVDNTKRLEIERMEKMTEEELDELYRPKKTNSRKSLAPLFVYSILKSKSNSKTHLRQKEILDALAEYPYEIFLERKALSRILHNLSDDGILAVMQDKSGVWIDQE